MGDAHMSRAGRLYSASFNTAKSAGGQLEQPSSLGA